jgi:hypothetical protein
MVACKRGLGSGPLSFFNRDDTDLTADAADFLFRHYSNFFPINTFTDIYNIKALQLGLKYII